MYVKVKFKKQYSGQLKNHGEGYLVALAVVAFNFLDRKTYLQFEIRTFVPPSVSVFSKDIFKE